MPKTLADGRIKLVVLTTKPADPKAPTVAELKAGKVISCRILKSDYRLSATGSETVNEPELCSTSNAQAFGATNYEGTVTPFRFLNSDGTPESDEDIAWDAFKEKGTTLWLAEREGPVHDKEFAAGDIVDLYEVITDAPQKPSDRSGYIKRTVPLAVQKAWEQVTVAA